MRRVRVALRAELLQLHPVRVVTPVLLGDVVALLALRARQGDLRPDVGCLLGHRFLFSYVALLALVAGAGLEPATQRL